MSIEPSASRSPQLLSAARSRLLIIDVQEKLIPVIPEIDSLIRNTQNLITSAELLEVPVSATEQYPKGLGATVSPLVESLPERVEKLRFSSADAVEWGRSVSNAGDRHQVVLAGIEAHVCVLQTAFDLLANGFEVCVVSDAVNSRHEHDAIAAMQRMRDAGVTLVTTEMVLFEWCETAAHPAFKQISQLVRNG